MPPQGSYVDVARMDLVRKMMKDMGVFCQHLRPEGAGPERDQPMGTVAVLAAMAECPSFESLTVAIKNAPADQQKATTR